MESESVRSEISSTRVDKQPVVEPGPGLVEEDWYNGLVQEDWLKMAGVQDGWFNGLVQRVGSMGWLNGLGKRAGSTGWFNGFVQ